MKTYIDLFVTSIRFVGLALIALLSRGELLADAPLEGTKPAQWRVIWTADPAHQATISWSTAKPAKSFQLRYWEKSAPSERGTLGAELGKYVGGEFELYYYHARLRELKASTAYEFQIVSDQHLSPVMFFVTAPDDDRPFSILVGGDSRTDQDERRRVNQLMAKTFAKSHANDDPNDDIIALAHGGDYIARGTDLSQWSRWLSDHELTKTDGGRMLPIIPTRGNHDKGNIFNPLFGFPDDDKNYYAINLGAQVRLVTLNTETATAGDQAAWLNRELGASRPKHRWLVAQYHRPAYPAVKAPGTALQSWVPLFDKHHMDLACEQDGHTIKRTVPIRGNVQDKTGVIYIGEGGLGVQQRTPKPERWYLKPPGMSGSSSHFHILRFSPQSLLGICQRLDGEVADKFVLNPRDLETLFKKKK